MMPGRRPAGVDCYQKKKGGDRRRVERERKGKKRKDEGKKEK